VVNAGALVLATGARERFLPFTGWTLPGVVGVGGAQALLKSGLSFKDKRVVIAGSGPLILPVAAALAAEGARLVLVAEQASRRAVGGFALGLWRRPGALVQAARYRAGFLRTPYATGTWVLSARGGERLEAVSVTDGRATRTMACDVLCSAYGLVPNTELARLLGCELSRGAVAVDERQQTSRADIYCVGETTGVGGVDLALVEGEIAGLYATGRDGAARRLHGRRSALRAMADAMARAFAPRAELRAAVRPETIVCRCEDVTLGAISPRWTVRQAKLYTRAGMGPCQGRVCGAALEFLFGWPADTARMPSEPARLSTILADAADAADVPLHQGALK
jgi:NADPH-dependent 2,4-dienoyl-CoA reductase/sulfur reductase-like enzyme